MDTSATRHLALKRVLSDIGLFSERLIGRPLRPYQLEAARAIVTSVLERQGRAFSSNGSSRILRSVRVVRLIEPPVLAVQTSVGISDAAG